MRRFLPAKTQRAPRFYGVYLFDRQFGGQEEGGWWFNWYQLVATFPIPNSLRKARNSRKRVAWESAIVSRFQDLAWGNPYHSTGGEAITGMLDEFPGQNQTRYRPHYE